MRPEAVALWFQPSRENRMDEQERQRHGRVTARHHTGETEDTTLLERRDPSFLRTDPWLVMRVTAEFVEALTLIQTGKILHFPVALVGSSYWQGLIDWLSGPVLGEGKVSPDDLELFRVCDTPDEVVEHVMSVLSRKKPTDPRTEPVVQP